jgi:prepilin signal peptidase PulO-like enzyme (type II secretory pathway)
MEEEETPTSESRPSQIPLPIVISRIVIVTSIGFAAALGLFLLIAGAWEAGLILVGAMFVFILLMLLLEWRTERGSQERP